MARRLHPGLLTFRLRTLFLFVSLACVCSAWKVRVARTQQEAAVAIRESGGRVEYDYEHVSEPHWLATHLGVDFCHDVVLVTISITPESAYSTGDSLHHLSGFHELRWLSIDGPMNDEDLKLIGELKGLWTLHLYESGICGQGFEHLSSLTDLLVLECSGNPVDDAALRFVAGLPKLKEIVLDDTMVTDSSIPTLASMASLRTVSLIGTRVSKNGAAELRKLRPDMTVVLSGDEVPFSVVVPARYESFEAEQSTAE